VKVSKGPYQGFGKWILSRVKHRKTEGGKIEKKSGKGETEDFVAAKGIRKGQTI